MRINDYVKLARAKIMDAKSEFIPKGYYERVERNLIKMKTSDINARQFQEGLDDFWLVTREMVNFNREMSKKIREIRERYEREGEDPVRDGALFDLEQVMDEKADEYAVFSEGFRQFREKYYACRRGEISEAEFVEDMHGFKLSGVQNAN